MTHRVINPASAPNAVALQPLVTKFEQHLCDAYAAFGELAAALPRARNELGLSPVVGHNVLSHFTDAGAAVATALGHSVSGHRTIDKVAQALGIETATGDGRDKPVDDVFYPGLASAALAGRERAAA